MSSVNRFITGPAGSWINAILMAVAIFFLTNLYSDVKEWSRMLYKMQSQIELHEYRLDVIDHIK